jgi:aminoglycoside phosphotransferase (APT) family kinase protein
VLRRAPHGPLAPSTHDVLREAAWMRALRPAGIPVPVVVDGSDDPAIVGTPFFVMELVEGFVPGPGSGAIPEAVDQPDGRRSIVEAFVDALAALHRVPADLPGLARFHRPGNYLERQIERFSGLWERNRTRSLPDVDDLTGWLRSNIPATLRVGVVHGDARPGNAVFRPRADGRAELVGLLDWEMAAIGDPLADVGYLLATWAEGTDPHDPLFDVSIWTRAPGYPTREEIATRYAELTGTSMAELRFYVVLALWKAVILMEGNLRRYLDGQADNPYFETYVDGLPPIADRGRRLTEQS